MCVLMWELRKVNLGNIINMEITQIHKAMRLLSKSRLRRAGSYEWCDRQEATYKILWVQGDIKY